LTPKKTKFLLVDDDADDAFLFCEALHHLDPMMVCLTAENGREVFNKLSKQEATRPDIIFLDINMPIMDGWECLRRLKNDASLQNIPAIMYSTSSSKKDIEMAYQLGARLFVTKPEDFAELHKILEVVSTRPADSWLQHLSKLASVKVA
jgi:CheY-like chemotaxis protein